MNLAIFYDTETTGFPSGKKFDDDPCQPHIVQLAAHLVDTDTREIVSSMDVIVKPDCWEIPQVTTDVHGISTEHALAVGVPEDEVVSMFLRMWQGRTRIAHNEQFDAKILRIAAMRFKGKVCADVWRQGPAECTSDMTQNIINLPPSERMIKAGRTGPKKPRMSEAYKHFTGKELENAHSAIADVNGCMDVYWAVKDLDNS